MFLEHQLRWESMGLIDLDASFFVQLVIFLVFLALINLILFRPLMKVFDERRARTQGAREDAVEQDREAKEMIARYEANLSQALEEGAELRAQVRSDALSESQAEVKAARAEYEKKLEAGAAAAASEYAQAARSVEQVSVPLGEAIAQKLLSK